MGQSGEADPRASPDQAGVLPSTAAMAGAP